MTDYIDESGRHVHRVTGRDIVHLAAAVVAVLVPLLMIVFAVIAAVVYSGTSLLSPGSVGFHGVLELAAVLTFYFTMRREQLPPAEYEIVLGHDREALNRDPGRAASLEN